MLTEMRDTVGLTMLGHGHRPVDGRRDDAEQGARQDRAGRRTTARSVEFTGNEYLQDLENGELRRLHGLVGRHRQLRPPTPTSGSSIPDEGGMQLVRHHGHPERRAERARPPPSGSTSSTTRTTPAQITDYGPVHLAGEGRAGRADEAGWRRRRRSPTTRCVFPTAEVDEAAARLRRPPPTHDERSSDQRVHRDHRRTERGPWPKPATTGRSASGARRAVRLLLAPGHALADPVLPRPAVHAAPDRAVDEPEPVLPNYDVQLALGELRRRVRPLRRPVLRSFVYAGVATVLCVLIGYPLAYFIAFGRAVEEPAARPRGRAVLHALPDPHDRLADHPRRRGPGRRLVHDLHLPGSPTRSAHHQRRHAPQHPPGGDRRPHLQLPAVHGAADLREPREDRRRLSTRPRDLYSTPARAFRKVVLPAVAARACSPARCSTFIPAAGDFINAGYLGNPQTR